jgi:prepilin-type N-terminal cleavage/methylation domain-containing protein
MSYSLQTRSVRRTQTREGDSTRLVKVETQATSTALRTGGAGLDLYVRVGFTFIEILIVIVLIGIVAMIAVPMISSSASMQIHSAANIIAADLEYAKSMAISRGQNFSVVFDKSAESYRIENQDGDVITHPVKKGFDYIVSFADDSRLDSVDIVDVDFDPGSNQTITFDYLGSPHSGTEATNPLNSGIITLQAGGITKTISIEAVTGYISIAD